MPSLPNGQSGTGSVTAKVRNLRPYGSMRPSIKIYAALHLSSLNHSLWRACTNKNSVYCTA